MENNIKDHFKNLGFTDVTVNNWRGKRLYVNLTDSISFSYDLTQDYKISSDVLLDTKIFKEAIKAVHQSKKKL